MFNISRAVIAIAALLICFTTAVAEDNPIRDKALKLNQVTGTTAMGNKLVELIKDKAGTEKLLETAQKMLKEEKPLPLNFNACFILAKAAQAMKKMEVSLAFYKVCAENASKIGSASKIVDVFDGMIDLYAQNKKYDEAIQACQEFLDLQIEDGENPINQMKPFVMEKLIVVTARKGKLDDALKLTDNLIEKDKGGWYFVRLKGDILREGEKYGDAADTYHEAIERLSKNKRMEEDQKKRFTRSMRYALSGVFVDMKQIDKGAEQLEILLKDDPENPTFLNDLGYIWIDHDMKIEEGEKLIRKALEKDREERKKIEGLPKDRDVDNAAYLDSLGWVLFKKKDYKEAKKYMEQAVKMEEGKHVEIYDHLAQIHMALGEKEEAIKNWKEALKLENTTKREKERIKEIEKKVKELEAKK